VPSQVAPLASTPKPVTLITGASAGIGAAFARLFAERGHECVLVARREAQLGALASEIAKAGRKRPHVLALDLAEREVGARIAKELAARGLEPAIVVNNAGFGLHGAAATLDRHEQLAMIDLNVRVLTDLSLRFVTSLRRYGGGVINIASLAAFFPGPGMAVYFAGKAYVRVLSEALHRELAPLGVKVTCVCAGPVPTEFQARAGLGPEALSPMMTRSAERIARDSYDGFMRGKPLVVPGFVNKVVTVLPRFMPRALVLRAIASYQLKNAPKPPEIDTGH
jgi:short-subunit dehydrogenase